MRKLIVAGIISVLVIIAFISYLRYDTYRFTTELPSIPDASAPAKEQVKNTAKDTSVASPSSITEPTTGNEKGSQLPTEGTSEDIAHPDKLRSNTETGGGVQGSGQTSDGTKLSPEIVALYTDLQPLYDEYVTAAVKYMLVMTKLHETADRRSEIMPGPGSNPETASPETTKEIIQLQTWITANYPIYQELQAERDRRIDAMRTLIESRGFSYGNFDWKVFSRGVVNYRNE